MTTWILVDGRLPPDERRIYCSCETFRKRALVSDGEGKVEDGIVHGVASVFCPQQLRGRGYAQRHMRELRRVLTTWQADERRKVLGSVLYSDIGKDFYAKLGWMPNNSNIEMVFKPVQANWPHGVRPIYDGDLQVLCHRDEQSIRAALSRPARKPTRRVVITPDLDHMLWHIGKESFATKHLFGKESQIRGAITGSAGMQAWVIWTRRYYRRPDDASSDAQQNVLYILRLVLEGDETANGAESALSTDGMPMEGTAEQRAALRSIILAAMVEAAEWKLDVVKLWNPSPLVRCILARQRGKNGLIEIVEREEAGIASALWFSNGQENAGEGDVVWCNNEHYAWC